MTKQWDKLSDETQEALLVWINCDPDDEEKELLAALWNVGRFEYWDCPGCGESCRKGNPASWEYFQGVNEVDYISYPGDLTAHTAQYNCRLCDNCRSVGYAITQWPTDVHVGPETSAM